jgi:tRNA A58 N-methylase Trm61
MSTAWAVDADMSISEEEAAAFAALVTHGLVVETGTGQGVGTARLRAALSPSVDLISLDLAESPRVQGVATVKADCRAWTPEREINGLFVDDSPGRVRTIEHLRRFLTRDAVVFVHDAELEQIGFVTIGRAAHVNPFALPSTFVQFGRLAEAVEASDD